MRGSVRVLAALALPCLKGETLTCQSSTLLEGVAVFCWIAAGVLSSCCWIEADALEGDF
jgi:hypothetical protein